jgi:hypothetical protein
MGARISAATEKAVKLVQGGEPVFKAAMKAGIYPSTLYAALKRLGVSVIPKQSKEKT